MEYGSLKVKLSTHVLFKDFNDICHFGSGYEHVFTIIPMAVAFLHLAGGQYVLFFFRKSLVMAGSSLSANQREGCVVCTSILPSAHKCGSPMCIGSFLIGCISRNMNLFVVYLCYKN